MKRDTAVILLLLWLLWQHRADGSATTTVYYIDPDTGDRLPVPEE